MWRLVLEERVCWACPKISGKGDWGGWWECTCVRWDSEPAEEWPVNFSWNWSRNPYSAKVHCRFSLFSAIWDLNLWPPLTWYPLTTAPHMHFSKIRILFLLILCSIEFKLIVWDLKWIQIKKLSTTKLHNFSRSTTFVLVISPSKVVRKNQILNLRNSNIVFLDKMTLNKKVVNYKAA
jgi:hypothetical protein